MDNRFFNTLHQVRRVAVRRAWRASPGRANGPAHDPPLLDLRSWTKGSWPQTRREALDSWIDDLEASYSLASILDDAGVPASDQSRPHTDRDRLRAVSAHALRLEHESCERAVLACLAHLEERIEHFSSEDFSTKRFKGWCGAVRDLNGNLLFANRYLLYKAGLILDDELVLERLQSLLLAGLAESERRFGSGPSSARSWLEPQTEDQRVCRARLATALNFLARESYAFGSRQPLKLLTKHFLQHDFDVLVLSAGRAAIPFTRRDDALLVQLGKSLDEAALLFLGDDAPYLQEQRNPLADPQPTALVLTALLAAADQMRRAELVQQLIDSIGLDESNAGPAAAIVAKYAPTGCELPSTSMGPVLRRALRLVRDGRVAEAREIFPRPKQARSMQLGELHPYMRLIPVVYRFKGQVAAIREVRRRLVELAPAHHGTTTFMARAVEFDSLVDDHLVIAQANLLFERHRPADDEVRDGDTVVMFLLDQDRVTPALLAPLAGVLAAGGMKLRSLQQSGFGGGVGVATWDESPVLTADCAACVDVPVAASDLLGDWVVDLEARKLELDGVNYYQGMYERVSRVLKVFHVDWSLPSVQVYYENWLRQIDRILYALSELALVAEDRDLQIRLVSLQSHFTPYFALKQYAAAHPGRFEHITLSSSYENWKNNVDGRPLGTLTVLNNTCHPQPSAPAFGTADEFEQWYRELYLPDRDRFVAMSDRLTGLRRSGARTPDAALLVDRWTAQKAETGAMLFCALGKIPFDLAVPYQGGPAHSDLADWINHTIHTVGESGNALLVKPHPHELNYAISGKPMEGFLDLIDVPLRDNVALLPHRGVSLQDLLDIVDVFLVWNGSSIAELGAQGAVVVAADDWAARNYPLGVRLPRDRAEYEQILTGQFPPEMAPDFRDRCVAYNCFLTEAPFAIATPFVERSSTNTNFNRARLRFGSLDQVEHLDAPSRQRVLEAFR